MHKYKNVKTITDDIQAAGVTRTIAASHFTARLRAGLARWWERNRVAVIETLVVFITARVVLSLVAVAAAAMLPEQSGLQDVYHAGSSIWLDVWARWDSEWYLGIAQYGYAWRSELIAFFPLYPLLVSTLAAKLGQNYVLAGVVVSTVASFVAMFYLYKLATLEFGTEIASRALLYLAAFPTAFFLFAVYTESLFLAVTIAAFYYARRAQWGLAAAAAFLASITRQNGWVLMFPLAYEAWRQAGSNLRANFTREGLERWIAVAAVALGLFVWFAYLAWLTRDPLAYVHREGQEPWVRVISMPWATVAAAFGALSDSAPSPMMRVVNTFELAAALLLIESSVAAWWRLPRVYAIYLAATTLLLFSSFNVREPLQSFPRFTLVLFPLFLLLGQLGENRHWHRAILLFSLPLLGLFTALFATSYWIF